MKEILLNDNNKLINYGKPYVVAELNTSHFGDIGIAKTMIDEAKNAGCNCVKFQSWNENTLYSKTYYDENPIAKRFVKKFSFSKEELLTLSNYCNKKNISFASTPYSFDEVDTLVKECDVPFIKVASMDISSHYLLEYIANTNKPIILSTGMSEISEIEEAISVIENQGNTNICILHCVSIYPTPLGEAHLNRINFLKKLTKSVGFSDHSETPKNGILLSVASLLFDVSYIERHFTVIDKSKTKDGVVSLDAKELKNLVDFTKKDKTEIEGWLKENFPNYKDSFGQETRKLSNIEILNRGYYRGRFASINSQGKYVFNWEDKKI